MRLTLDRQVLVGFGVAMAVLVGTTALSWRTTGGFMRASTDAVYHAEIVVPLQSALSRIYAAEAAQRGYLASGAPAFLAQRNEALERATTAVNEVRALAQRDQELLTRLDRVSKLAQARTERLNQVLGTYRDSPEQARAMLASGFGRPEMEALDREVSDIAAHQHELLRSNADSAREDATRVYLIFAAAVATAVAMLVAISRLILRGLEERRRAHAALAASQARLDAIFNTALDAIIVIDDRGRIDRFNAAAERMFGYTAEEAIGQNVAMLLPTDERDSHDGHLERYRRTGVAHVIGVDREVVAQRKNGEQFPAEMALAGTSVNGQRLFAGVLRDISERKAAESRQAELMHDLQAANEELGNFAYVASHDLKAPLRAIGSLAQWLSTDYADRFDTEGREHMALLLSRVKRMDRLIDGILQYSRVGRVKSTPTQVDLNTLVRETVDLLAPPDHVKVTVEPLPVVRMDRTRAQQVFQNLLSNAIKFMDKPQGEIQVGCRDTGEDWHFSVRDNGPGIERRHWERVFQLFQSLSARDTTESTGVGLSLVKKIVELHGGHIWLESEVGLGSTFHFTLPKEMPCT